jgi:glycosyltransferase involved in cell wall biosynthesis/SAM-dependent methyltransferase
MPDNSVGLTGFRCAVCGCEDFVPLARRSDGVQVVRCARCGMGVIDAIPDDLMAYYGDDYFGAGQVGGGGETGRGYEDYAYTAEHGVDWAAALVKLLRPAGGRVLDIGCADGHLLAKLGPDYAVFGIEANQATGQIAAERGVVVLGRDLVDPLLIESYKASFDVITAIAVFEHLRDIRSGIEAALRLLRDDGVLLFEVPLMSAVHDNTVWLTSSLEHVWYPSEQGLRQLVQTELGAQLLGTELFITGYGSTYVGLAFHNTADRQTVRELAARVLLREADPASFDEATACMLLHLVHAATATHADVGVLANLPPAMLNQPLLRRFSELWQADLWRIGLARAATSEEQAHTRQLKADLNVIESDRVRSHNELTTSLIVAQTQLATAQADLKAQVAAEIGLGRQRAELNRQRAELDRDRAAAYAAIAAAQAIQSGAAWRVATILREAARRYPRIARPARRAARVIWWTVRGRLIGQLRLRRQIRARLGANSATRDEAPVTPPIVRAMLSVSPSPPNTPVWEPDVFLLDETGHRPPLLVGTERPADWPLVSVIVTSFNYGQFVADAVDSVLAQTFKDLEVIVVEGGSSDPTSRFVVAGLQRPRTRVLMQGAGHKAGANRNFGISQARGRYVCCLDADDTLAPTYIEKAIFLLEKHGYDVVSCAMKMVGDEQGQINIMEQPDLDALLEGNQVLTCAVFRRSLWEQAGGYRDADQAVSGYVYEDWAFWVRLAALGARFRNLYHDPLLRYRVHGGSLSRGKDVLPESRQRQMVRQMNRDVLQSVAAQVTYSRKKASVQYGTPSTPPAVITLDRARAEPRPPTLLLAMPFLILGGAERLLSAVVAHLVQTGWRVVITTSIETGIDHGDTTPWFEPHTSEIFHLPRCLPPELWEDFVHHLVRSRDVDVVWVVGSALAYDCLRGLRTAHPNLRVADLLFNTLGHTANNRRRRDLIDLNFVENHEVHKWLVAHGEDTTRIRLVESGVDLAVLRPMARSETLTRQIGAKSDDLIVGFSGRWSEEKNPLGFVEIARLVDPALPVRFVMTGTGHLRLAIEHAIHDARFPEGRFHLLGEVPEIAPVLASFDLLVVPSVLDGRPVVVLEALSMGVPVLASNVGALPELIRDNRTGWMCDPNNLKAFAERIEDAERDRASLQDMRRWARDYAEDRLDMQAMLTAYRTALVSLLPKDRCDG